LEGINMMRPRDESIKKTFKLVEDILDIAVEKERPFIARPLLTRSYELFDPSMGSFTKSQELSACGAAPPADQTV
jgi:hypothetical protein